VVDAGENSDARSTCPSGPARIRLPARSEQAFAIIREQLDFEDWVIDQREAVAAHIKTGSFSGRAR